MLASIAECLPIHGAQHLQSDPEDTVFFALWRLVAAQVTADGVCHVIRQPQIFRYILAAMKTTVDQEDHRLPHRDRRLKGWVVDG